MQSRALKRLQKSKAEANHSRPADNRWRHPFVYIFSFIILIIIVVSFVGGPLLSGIGRRSTIVFGSWGGEEIEFVSGNYLSRQRDILYDQVLENRSNESYEWQAYSVWKGAFDRTVLHTAILVTADRSNLHISDIRVDATLLSSGPYMDNGEFSEALYKNTSNADRHRYRTLVRDDLIHQQYTTDLNHEVMFSSAAAEFFVQLASNERSFSFVQFTYDNYPQEALETYAALNEKLFQKIKLGRITMKSSATEAEAIRRQIVDGEQTFEDQAKNHSTDGFSERGGEMGWREYHSLQSDFSNQADLDTLFQMRPGDITEVYETDFGFVFYRIDEATILPDFETEEDISTVRSYMERFERGQIEDYLLELAESFRSDVDSGMAYSLAASNRGLEVFDTGFFPVNYGGTFFLPTPRVDGEAPEADLGNAAYNERFFSVLFALDENASSTPIILDESVAVFRLKEERIREPDDVEFISSYYPYIYQQFLDQDLSDYVFSSDEFEDDFARVFSEIFLSE